MRTFFVLMFLTAVIGISSANQPDEKTTDRLGQLVKQLGHANFAIREQAGKELDAIGEPALAALRKAASGDDVEVRRRAEQLIASITQRAREAVTKKELEKLQGTWIRIAHETNGQRVNIEDMVFIFKGDKWKTIMGEQLAQGGTVKSIEVKGKFNTIDLPITEGGNIGVTAISIYAIEGDTLKYLNCEPRANDFSTKPGDGRNFSLFRRAKDGDKPRPAEVNFASAVFSTDLVVAESKKAIHRVTLKCRPADGEAGTLTLDAGELIFNEFGDPIAPKKVTPVLTLDCTLKLVKTENGRQIYELHGAKVQSRFSLVVSPGDGRLLVHGSSGDVRHVIDLVRPDLRFPTPHRAEFNPMPAFGNVWY